MAKKQTKAMAGLLRQYRAGYLARPEDPREIEAALAMASALLAGLGDPWSCGPKMKGAAARPRLC